MHAVHHDYHVGQELYAGHLHQAEHAGAYLNAVPAAHTELSAHPGSVKAHGEAGGEFRYGRLLDQFCYEKVGLRCHPLLLHGTGGTAATQKDGSQQKRQYVT